MVSGEPDVAAGPADALLVTRPLTDPDRWKAGWDSRRRDRLDVGFDCDLILRSVVDPMLVTVLLEARSTLRSTLAPWGVSDGVVSRRLTVLRSNLIRDRQLMAALTVARATDIDVWLPRDDLMMPQRAAAGIVGHFVARDVADPDVVVVIDQVERGSVIAPLLEGAYSTAVLAPPLAVGLHVSGWGATYTADPPQQVRTPSAKEQRDMQVIATHEVDDVERWFTSPKRKEFFAARGMTATAFRDPAGQSSSVAVLIEAPDMETLQRALEEPEAAEAEAHDGVRVDTLRVLVAE